MQSAELLNELSMTGAFQLLANQIIATANTNRIHYSPPPAKEPKRLAYVDTPADLLHNLSVAATASQDQPLTAQDVLNLYLSDAVDEACIPPQEQLAPIEAKPVAPPLATQKKPAAAAMRPHLPGQFIKVGPYELRPAEGMELPFGRDYQHLPHQSISRLAGFVGLDPYSLYIREVPAAPEMGLKPSRNGIWVKQPGDAQYRRLQPGQAERITPETQIRVGGNGNSAETGLPVDVID